MEEIYGILSNPVNGIMPKKLSQIGRVIEMVHPELSASKRNIRMSGSLSRRTISTPKSARTSNAIGSSSFTTVSRNRLRLNINLVAALITLSEQMGCHQVLFTIQSISRLIKRPKHSLLVLQRQLQ